MAIIDLSLDPPALRTCILVKRNNKTHIRDYGKPVKSGMSPFKAAYLVAWSKPIKFKPLFNEVKP